MKNLFGDMKNNKMLFNKDKDKLFRLSSVINSIDQRREDILFEAINEIRPSVIGLLLRKLNGSGLQTKTGQLKTAVSNAEIKFLNGGLYISMKGDDNFMAKTAALNYGAVFAPRLAQNIKDLPTGEIRGRSVRSILGEKAKRTVKYAVFGDRRGKKTVLSKRQKLAQGAIESESLRYIKPRWFFTLNDTERGIVLSSFNAAVKKALTSRGLELR